MSTRRIGGEGSGNSGVTRRTAVRWGTLLAGSVAVTGLAACGGPTASGGDGASAPTGQVVLVSCGPRAETSLRVGA